MTGLSGCVLSLSPTRSASSTVIARVMSAGEFGEGKTMGLAAYAEPEALNGQVDRILMTEVSDRWYSISADLLRGARISGPHKSSGYRLALSAVRSCSTGAS